MNKEVSIAANVFSGHDNEKEKIEVQEREEIIKIWKQMDEKLEIKAKSFNLTAINVKSILHHMIKNPHVISVIMGLDKNCAIADLKLTRSKTKHLSAQEVNFDPKEKDVSTMSRASRTFLDVNYDSNEDDDDYLPEQDADASEGEIENNANITGISQEVFNNALQVRTGNDHNDDVAPALHTRSKQSTVLPDDARNVGHDVLLYTAVNDPEYVEFISNLNDPSKYDFDETEDPEYNFLSDADAEDIIEEDEVRKDRATEIPLREVENLLQDLLEARLLPSPEHLEQAIDFVKDENKSCQSIKQDDHKSSMRRTKPLPTGSLPENVEPTTVFVDASQDDFEKVSATSSSLLCASIENPPFFSFYELQQLIAQLEKHVQLLTQFAVGCYFNDAMVKIYNAFQIMINELNDYCLERPEHSLFNVVNLEACITTCHDAIECESISDFIHHRRKSRKPHPPLPKTMFVLSRSEALLFPELLPQVRMEMFPTFYPYFTREEECLLALGLYQFAHLKQFSEKRRRYALINQHLLANKTQSQIRLHLKNFRSSDQPVHILFLGAETGTVNMIFPLENRSTAISGPPYLWPQHLQPIWLKELVDRQHFDLEFENFSLDGLTFAKITNGKNSASVDRLNSDHSSRTSDEETTSTPTASDTDDNPLEPTRDSAVMNGPINTTFSSIRSENTEVDGIPSSPVRNLLLFASTPVCEITNSSSSPTSGRSRVASSVNKALLAASSQFSTIISSANGSTVVGNISSIRPVRLAPFKKMPSTEAVDIDECEESDSERYEIEMIGETDESTESNTSDEEIVMDSSFPSNLRTSICSQFSRKSKYDCCDGTSSHVNTANLNLPCPVEASTHRENAMNLKWISNTSNGDIDRSNLARWKPTKSPHYCNPMMLCMKNKAIQCDLTAFNNYNEMTRILEYNGNSKDDIKIPTVSCDPAADCIRTFESVHCTGSHLPQDNEEDGGPQKEQNEQTVSNNGGQNNESVRDEQQLPADTVDGNKLPDDRERDGSDGEGNGSVDEEKRRRRVRTRKDRVRDGLHGMLDAGHRALQMKCMAHVIFNDFEQRMFMYQDKVRALCELIAKGAMCAEMFERMRNIFEKEHEPLYFLLSFLFPQNLLPASVLENPIRKAYGDALEMIYNIEAFTSFGNTRLSARTIFRNIRDLGFDCTCEALTTRLSELIGNKGPLWEIISQNIPTRTCHSNYSVMDFEYVDLCNWRKIDAPFESVDLATAIGAQTEKQRSGVFVGFLRNLFTEKKGKLYEVVAEWKQTKITPPAVPRRRLPVTRAKKRKYKIPNKVETAKLPKKEIPGEIPSINRSSVQDRTDDVISIISQRKNVTASQFIRKRPIQPMRIAETRKKRSKNEGVQINQSGIFTENDNMSTIEIGHTADFVENLDEGSGNSADISLVNIAESRILRAEIVQCGPLSPDMVKPTRKWTIEEDRKILHIHKENGPDLDLTLASAQSALPDIPIEELRQRLKFLLNILDRIEDTGSK